MQRVASANPKEGDRMEHQKDVARDATAEAAQAGNRHRFLRAAGMGGLAVALPGVLAACGREVVAPGVARLATSADRRAAGTVVLDSATDVGVLNYAYALEQLEAAFYVQVMSTPYAAMTVGEGKVLSDLRDHEVLHRDFFAAALGSAKIANLTPNFTAVLFNDRRRVLKTAMAFEDLGVAAYNGAAKYLKKKNRVEIITMPAADKGGK